MTLAVKREVVMTMRIVVLKEADGLNVGEEHFIDRTTALRMIEDGKATTPDLYQKIVKEKAEETARLKAEEAKREAERKQAEAKKKAEEAEAAKKEKEETATSKKPVFRRKAVKKL